MGRRRFAPPTPLAEVLEASAPLPEPKELFESVPSIMRDSGRVEGFESLRDLLLANWRELAAAYDIPLQALLKLVLETDRHALFAMLSEEKLGDADKSKQRAHKWFQDYLMGEVDGPLSPETKLADLPSGAVSGEDNGRDQDVQG